MAIPMKKISAIAMSAWLAEALRRGSCGGRAAAQRVIVIEGVAHRATPPPSTLSSPVS